MERTPLAALGVCRKRRNRIVLSLLPTNPVGLLRLSRAVCEQRRVERYTVVGMSNPKVLRRRLVFEVALVGVFVETFCGAIPAQLG